MPSSASRTTASGSLMSFFIGDHPGDEGRRATAPYWAHCRASNRRPDQRGWQARARPARRSSAPGGGLLAGGCTATGTPLVRSGAITGSPPSGGATSGRSAARSGTSDRPRRLLHPRDRGGGPRAPRTRARGPSRRGGARRLAGPDRRPEAHLDLDPAREEPPGARFGQFWPGGIASCVPADPDRHDVDARAARRARRRRSGPCRSRRHASACPRGTSAGSTAARSAGGRGRSRRCRGRRPSRPSGTVLNTSGDAAGAASATCRSSRRRRRPRSACAT